MIRNSIELRLKEFWRIKVSKIWIEQDTIRDNSKATDIRCSGSCHGNEM